MLTQERSRGDFSIRITREAARAPVCPGDDAPARNEHFGRVFSFSSVMRTATPVVALAADIAFTLPSWSAVVDGARPYRGTVQ